MPIPYIVPGVSVSEVVSPAFSTFLPEPTSICVIGPGQGFEQHTEVALLSDNAQFVLATTGIDTTTLVVVDAANVNSSPFVPTTPGAGNKDYDIDTSTVATDGLIKVKRSMQTLIKDGETVVVYYENSASPVQADGHTEWLALNKLTPVTPVNVTSATQAASILVKRAGRIPAGDYTITGAGSGTVTIARQVGATIVGKYQVVYIDYVLNSVQYNDVAFQLNATSTVALPANSTGHVVKNAPQAPTATAIAFTKASATTDSDYNLTGTGATTAIARSAGTTTIGVSTDSLVVKISYSATPTDYYQPTKCFNQGQVEAKFGAAFDGQGNLLNPVAFAAGLSFENGASSVVVQALYSLTNSVRGVPTGSQADWSNTLAGLQGVSEINVIVPIHSTGSLTTSDGVALQVLSAVQTHISFMATQDVHIVAFSGEDSTKGNATFSTLRAHAASLGSLPSAQNMVLLSPASFTYPNPVNGKQVSIGGQFAAAAFAGLASANAVQTPLTRKTLVGISSVVDSRSQTEKNIDASNGLCVVENYKGRVRVRHAITTSRDSANTSELNVIRAKFYMLDQVRDNLDSQIIGRIPLDTLAPFRVQLVATTVLEQLVSDGVIVTYRGVQAQQNATNPSAIDLRYSYLPAYPLNYINISFSIDSSQGVVTTQSNIQAASI